MPRPQLQARFPEDTADAVEEYADEHDISRSEAMRRLVDEGLASRKREGIREDLEEIGEEMRADGGAVQERFDAIERRQERQEKADTALNALNAAGIIYIVAYFTGYLPDLGGLVVGAALFGALVATITYSAGYWGGTHE